MRSYLSDFNEISKAQVERDKALALDDLHNEMAGREVGRISRFLSDDARETATSSKRGGRSGEVLSALDLALMSDPAYAELYDGTFNRLRDAEAATERALMKAEEALAEARAALDMTLDRTATLEDGTRVFKDVQGNVWTEHGQMVDDATAAGIEWKGHEPAHETFVIREQAAQEAQAHIHALHGYQIRLGEFRERLTDEDNPVTKAELKDIDRRIRDLAPPQVLTEMAISPLPAGPVQEAGFSLPNLDGS